MNEDLALALNMVVMLSLATSAAPAAAGLSRDDDSNTKKILISLCFAVAHLLMALSAWLIGKALDYLVAQISRYVVVGLLVFVSAKMIIDSMQTLKGKRLYTAMRTIDVVLIALMSAFNTFMASLALPFFNTIGYWSFVILLIATFAIVQTFITKNYSSKMLRTTAFVQFSGGVFLAVAAILYAVCKI